MPHSGRSTKSAGTAQSGGKRKFRTGFLRELSGRSSIAGSRGANILDTVESSRFLQQANFERVLPETHSRNINELET